jgi:hypothetical protein
MENPSYKILVSGIGPGYGGVGKYMEFLINRFSLTEVYYPTRVNNSAVLITPILKMWRLLLFRLQIRKLQGQELVVLAHNYLDKKTLEKLISRNRCWFYLMDNNWFCVQSYNYNQKFKEECVRCLEIDSSESRKSHCQPQPSIRTLSKALEFNSVLKANSELINIVCLSQTNMELAKRYFSNANSYSYSYFITDDLLKVNPSEYKKSLKFDFVFHGSDQDVKGVDYVESLASILTDSSFFIPTSRKINLPNVVTEDLSWENGLDNLVYNAKIVLSPSIWSNTPEAAVLKNILWNGVCAVRQNKFGFNQEMPDDSYIGLTGSVTLDAQVLNSYLLSKAKRNALRKSSQSFFKLYKETAELQIQELMLMQNDL